MKKNLTFTGILIVLIISLTILSGCSEKKSIVKSDETKVQETVSAPAPAPAETTETATQENVSQPTETEIANEQSSLMEATAKSPISDIYFDFDSYSIHPDSREILKVNADYLLKHKVSSVVVEGHCDERGTAEYNMALGQRRAQETKKYLVNLGVNESIIKTISYGEERPLDPDNNEEAWAKNRRAHFVVNP
ncbi:MAG: hypothetical protein APR62_13020 [Smithella sp. SDB]|nr:MAG: hypothetical protein APR62_13020 [Smithella sp. SDB]